MKEMESNSALVEKEVQRKVRTAKWIQYFVVLLVILYIFLRFSRKVG